MRQKLEVEKCWKCGQNYNVIWTYYPTKLDDDRNSYYVCPYCKNVVNVHLQGNEDVSTSKINK